MASRIQVSQSAMAQRVSEYTGNSSRFAGLSDNTQKSNDTFNNQSEKHISALRQNEEAIGKMLTELKAMAEKHNNDSIELESKLKGKANETNDELTRVSTEMNEYEAEANARNAELIKNADEGESILQSMRASLTEIESEWIGDAGMSAANTLNILAPKFKATKDSINATSKEDEANAKTFNEKYQDSISAHKFIINLMDEFQQKERELRTFYESKFKQADEQYAKIQAFTAEFQQYAKATGVKYTETLNNLSADLKTAAATTQSIAESISKAATTYMQQEEFLAGQWGKMA